MSATSPAATGAAAALLPVLSAQAVADALGCKITTVEERARRGDLPGLKYGDGGWVFPVAALTQRLNQCALEEAQRRRGPKPAAAVLQVVGAKAKGARKAPPVLPRLGV